MLCSHVFTVKVQLNSLTLNLDQIKCTAIFFRYLTTDGSFTQDFILKNHLNYFTVDVYEHEHVKHV